MMDEESMQLFSKVWERFWNCPEGENPPIPIVIDDVFIDSPKDGGVGDYRGISICLLDKITMTVWEDGQISLADFGG